jgi:DNA-binding transcriptional MocR family regulator
MKPDCKFSWIPIDMLSVAHVSLLDKVVWLALNSFSGLQGDAHPSISALASRSGTSSRSVQRALVELVAAGWIQIVQKRSHKPTVYKVLQSDTGTIDRETIATQSIDGEAIVEAPTIANLSSNYSQPVTQSIFGLEKDIRPSFDGSKNPAKTKPTQETKPKKKTAAELAAMSPAVRGTFAEAWDGLKPAPVHAHVGSYNPDHDEDAHE